MSTCKFTNPFQKLISPYFFCFFAEKHKKQQPSNHVHAACSCDRTSCPCVDQPTCDVGEKLQVTNPGECCTQYKYMCDAATCPATNDTKCSFGHKLNQVVDNSKCCPVSTECICDATMCPLYISPPCDVSKGLKRVATSTRWTHPRQMACCPKVYEEVCTCDR